MRAGEADFADCACCKKRQLEATHKSNGEVKSAKFVDIIELGETPMYLDKYVIASLVLVAVMVVSSVWSIKKLKSVMAEDQAKADK